MRFRGFGPFEPQTLFGRKILGLLVESQKPDGHWKVTARVGSTELVDTCFALLFLKRANLAKDLTKKLEFVIEAKDPGKGR